MLLAAILYLLVFVFGLACFVGAIVLGRRRKFLWCVPLIIVALVLLLPTVNTAPAWLGWFGLLPGPHAARSGACERSSLIAASPVNSKTGDDSDSGGTPCATELVVNDGLPGSASVPAANCLAASLGTRPSKTCYSFGTIEFDGSGRAVSTAQIDAIVAHATQLAQLLRQTALADAGTPLSDNEKASDAPQLYVIAYAHGWRHDARRHDSDVRRLRLVAANAARNIAERCQVTRRDCRTAVLAIYLGWPGAERLVDLAPCESGGWLSTMDDKGGCARATFAGYLNGLSFPIAKAVSDRAGRGVVDRLTELRKRLSAIIPNKLLLLGHSLGGNLLLSGLMDAPVGADGRIGPADLTVLLNPAGETSKWVTFASKFGKGSWSVRTPPSVMFIATPCQFAPVTPSAAKEAPALCDDVVGSYFATSQRVVTGKLRGPPDDDIFGIGHVPLPTADSGQPTPPYYTNWLQLNGSGNLAAAGLTEGATTYSVTRRIEPSCFVEPSFLYCARERGLNDQRPREKCGGVASPAGTRWDFGAPGGRDPKSGLATELVGRFYDSLDDNRARSSIQLAAGTWPSDARKFASNSPAWGIRTDQSAVLRHNGIASAPLLCLFNKLLLDDASVRPAPGEGPCRFDARYQALRRGLPRTVAPENHKCFRNPAGKVPAGSSNPK